MKFRSAIIRLAWLAGIAPSLAEGQAVIEDKIVTDLGSAQVDDQSLKLLIAYNSDSAILELSIAKSGGPQRYIPMFGSTYRGIPAVTLNIIISQSKDQLWVQSSWPDQPTLAYYRLGADTAITPFGTQGLLDTPFPPFLTGEPLGFPKFDPSGVSTLATFVVP